MQKKTQDDDGADWFILIVAKLIISAPIILDMRNKDQQLIGRSPIAISNEISKKLLKLLQFQRSNDAHSHHQL